MPVDTETFYGHYDHMVGQVQKLNDISHEQIMDALFLFRKHPRVIFCAMGKPSFAVNKVVYTARSFGLDWHSLDVAHAFHGDAGIIKRGDLLVYVSKSGETKESVDVAQYFKDWDSIAIVSDKDSTLSKLCNHELRIPIDGEGSPFEHAPMASTTLYMIVMHSILCDVVKYTGCTIQEYARNHPAGKIGQDLKKEINA